MDSYHRNRSFVTYVLSNNIWFKTSQLIVLKKLLVKTEILCRIKLEKLSRDPKDDLIIDLKSKK